MCDPRDHEYLTTAKVVIGSIIAAIVLIGLVSLFSCSNAHAGSGLCLPVDVIQNVPVGRYDFSVKVSNTGKAWQFDAPSLIVEKPRQPEFRAMFVILPAMLLSFVAGLLAAKAGEV